MRFALVACALVVAGCGGEGMAMSGHSGTPGRCHPRQVADTLLRLHRSVRPEHVLGHLAPPGRFAWYSLTATRGRERLWHVVARERTGVVGLFAGRALQGQRLRPLGVRVAYERRRNLAHIDQLVFRYGSRDLGRALFGHGKGAIECRTGGLVAFSGGVDVDARQPRHGACGVPAAQLMRRRAVTACAR